MAGNLKDFVLTNYEGQEVIVYLGTTKAAFYFNPSFCFCLISSLPIILQGLKHRLLILISSSPHNGRKKWCGILSIVKEVFSIVPCTGEDPDPLRRIRIKILFTILCWEIVVYFTHLLLIRQKDVKFQLMMGHLLHML